MDGERLFKLYRRAFTASAVIVIVAMLLIECLTR